MTNESPEKLTITINFSPSKSDKTVKDIFRDRICRTLWLLWKRKHVCSQTFNEDVLRIGIRIGRLDAPMANLKKIKACFYPNQGDFTDPDIENFIVENIKHFDDCRLDFVPVKYRVAVRA